MFFVMLYTFAVSNVTNQPSTRVDGYVYVEDLNVRYSVYHEVLKDNRYQLMLYSGTLDAAGQFVPDPKSPPRIDSGGSATAGKLLSIRTGERLYGFYAGRLIPGVIKSNRENLSIEEGPGAPRAGINLIFFYPDLDGKVIELSEYLKTYDPLKSRRIYNLPGRIVKKSEVLIKQGEEKK